MNLYTIKSKRANKNKKMAQEIKETLHKTREPHKERKIKLLQFINTSSRSLYRTASSIEDFDYYKIIERDYPNFLVMCWEKQSDVSDVCVYIATYEEEEQ